MRTVVIAGPPQSGKTSLIRHLKPLLPGPTGVGKLDALHAGEKELFESIGMDCKVKLAGDYCPDHISFLAFSEFYEWGESRRLDTLLVETAGLCGRCSPFFKGFLSIFVLSYMSSVNLPEKMRGITANADVIVLTRGDIVASSERRIFRHIVKGVNPSADIIDFNGLTGESAYEVSALISRSPDRGGFIQDWITIRAPRGFCRLCLRET